MQNVCNSKAKFQCGVIRKAVSFLDSLGPSKTPEFHYHTLHTYTLVWDYTGNGLILMIAETIQKLASTLFLSQVRATKVTQGHALSILTHNQQPWTKRPRFQPGNIPDGVAVVDWLFSTHLNARSTHAKQTEPFNATNTMGPMKSIPIRAG